MDREKLRLLPWAMVPPLLWSAGLVWVVAQYPRLPLVPNSWLRGNSVGVCVVSPGPLPPTPDRTAGRDKAQPDVMTPGPVRGPKAGRPSRAEFTRETCAAIKRGMTRQQVEAILHCPPGDYTSGPWQYARGQEILEISGSYSSVDRWIDDRGEITIGFSTKDPRDGRIQVHWAHFFAVETLSR